MDPIQNDGQVFLKERWKYLLQAIKYIFGVRYLPSNPKWWTSLFKERWKYLPQSPHRDPKSLLYYHKSWGALKNECSLKHITV